MTFKIHSYLNVDNFIFFQEIFQSLILSCIKKPFSPFHINDIFAIGNNLEAGAVKVKIDYDANVFGIIFQKVKYFQNAYDVIFMLHSYLVLPKSKLPST